MKIFRLSTLVLILGLTMLLSGNLRAAAPHYRYHTTGQGAGGVAVAVNDNGQAVVNFNDRAYLWTLAGGLTDLDDLGGGKSYGYAINNLGQIVGESFIDDTTSHAFLWDGQMHDLGSLDGWIKSMAVSINNHGVIIGYYFKEGTPFWLPFQWTQAGGLQPLDLFGNPNKIIDDGRMVGLKNYDAWLWTASGAETDLGGLTGFYFSMAHDINQNGQVVGAAYSNSPPDGYPTHAFSWTLAGGIKDLGTTGRNSRAFGINNQGYIVGWSDFQGDYLFTRGALWIPGGELLNLDTLVLDKPIGVEIGDARAINKNGVIVGQGNSNGAPYMLVPNAPATGALLLLLD